MNSGSDRFAFSLTRRKVKYVACVNFILSTAQPVSRKMNRFPTFNAYEVGLYGKNA